MLEMIFFFAACAVLATIFLSYAAIIGVVAFRLVQWLLDDLRVRK